MKTIYVLTERINGNKNTETIVAVVESKALVAKFLKEWGEDNLQCFRYREHNKLDISTQDNIMYACVTNEKTTDEITCYVDEYILNEWA